MDTKVRPKSSQTSPVAPCPPPGLHGIVIFSPMGLCNFTPMTFLVLVHMASFLACFYLIPVVFLCRHPMRRVSLNLGVSSLSLAFLSHLCSVNFQGLPTGNPTLLHFTWPPRSFLEILVEGFITLKLQYPAILQNEHHMIDTEVCHHLQH